MKNQLKTILIALITILTLTSCSGGGSGGVGAALGVDIVVVDGYIGDAKVIDSNGNVAKYKSNGTYTFTPAPIGTITVTGGVFEDTGLPNTMTYKVSSSSRVVSPITSFLHKYPHLKERILTALGVDSTELLGDFVKSNKVNVAKLAQIIYTMNVNSLEDDFADTLTDDIDLIDIDNIVTKAKARVTANNPIRAQAIQEFLDVVAAYVGNVVDIEVSIKTYKEKSYDSEEPEDKEIYSYTYDGMILYSPDMSSENYKLKSYSDDKFNLLSEKNKRIVADKLLSSFYFGMPKEDITTLIESGIFISSINEMINSNKNDLASVEDRLNDSSREGEFYFTNSAAGAEEVAKILARFYVLKDLDKEYINYWSAYILTSTIMFSPAYELTTTHNPNIERVYSSLVRSFRDENTKEYTTFLHMISEDNWRRFRSPEDNGREMMEIFLQDFDDDLVPVAAQALKNWRLDRDHDTLVIGLDENTQPLNIFGSTVINGFDFYRELVKTSSFTKQVTSRLVNIYFPTFTTSQKNEIVFTIVSSNPNTYKDILLQIVFSERYLNDSDKPKAFEELFFSLAKKIHYKHRRGGFNYVARDLEDMNQPSMKYKLGRYVNVPLDTQSFSMYHKTIREDILIRYNSEEYDNRDGWIKELLIPESIFEYVQKDDNTKVLEHLIDHLFISVLARPAYEQEKNFFKSRMLDEDGNYVSTFIILGNKYSTSYYRQYASTIIMDYISRLSENYRFKKVQ